ncbi:MAG: hypothetical protein IPP57_22280 [Candidatus Obscuribacter sp.]|nr:hypothetical protein [Candidatus Obscuribacter sp.]
MAQAKYCYQVCMHYCKDPGTQAQCQAGIDSIEKFSQAKTTAPATSASSSSTKAPAKADDDDDDEEANLSPAKAAIERQKTQVMEEARKETAQIRNAAKEQIENEKVRPIRFLNMVTGTVAWISRMNVNVKS